MPANTPTHHQLGAAQNFGRWEPWVRASVIDFDLLSHLGFTSNVPGDANSIAYVWHVGVANNANPAVPPVATYKSLVSLKRPTEAAFRNQLALVANYADLRGDRASEILAQMGGAVTFFASIPFLHPSRNSLDPRARGGGFTYGELRPPAPQAYLGLPASQ